ncbi:MAG: hypothetical protein CM1200mP12_11670 [Gammaproteobacteria bacterium]|nr:MAG: hypothetical protein CM1200mP12_11670 [Gammaproteobacteria bacterium]
MSVGNWANDVVNPDAKENEGSLFMGCQLLRQTELKRFRFEKINGLRFCGYKTLYSLNQYQNVVWRAKNLFKTSGRIKG